MNKNTIFFILSTCGIFCINNVNSDSFDLNAPATVSSRNIDIPKLIEVLEIIKNINNFDKTKFAKLIEDIEFRDAHRLFKDAKKEYEEKVCKESRNFIEKRGPEYIQLLMSYLASTEDCFLKKINDDLELYNKVFEAKKAFDDFRIKRIIIRNNREILIDLLSAVRKDKDTPDAYENADFFIRYLEESINYPKFRFDVIITMKNCMRLHLPPKFSKDVNKYFREYEHNNLLTKEKMLILDDLRELLILSDNSHVSRGKKLLHDCLFNEDSIQKIESILYNDEPFSRSDLLLDDPNISNEAKKLIKKYRLLSRT